MNELTVFNFKNQQIRTTEINGEIYFVAKDISDILEYSETNRMTSRLDEDEFISTKLVDMNMKFTLLTESGLYHAILGSKKPEAKVFRKWVTSEVLPSLRKTGSYNVKPQYVPTEYEIKQQKLEISRLFEKISSNYDGKSKQILEAYAVKELSGEFLLPLPEQKKTYSASEIGKMLGVSPTKVGKISNQYNLKVDKYGEWFRDKSQYSNKEVSTFRYYDEAVPEMKKILKEEAVR